LQLAAKSGQLIRRNYPYIPWWEERLHLPVKGAEIRGESEIAEPAAALEEASREINRIELGESEDGGMTMKR
jgi:hypothetical protein